MRANKEELLQKVNENYDRLTDYGWNILIRLALKVIANGKPETKQEAIEQIERFYDLFTEEDRPSFLLQSNPFKFKPDAERILTNRL